MKKLPKDLFELTEDQIKSSKFIYDGLIIKCLIAPAFSYKDLESEIEYAPNTFLFPERELSAEQVRGFVHLLVKSRRFQEVNIITNSQEIIIDMIDDCVRVLDADMKIHNCPIKTFQANIHSIQYEILRKEYFLKEKETKSKGVEFINNQLFEKIQEFKTIGVISKSEKEKIEAQIDMIGEELISKSLTRMLDLIPVV